MKRIIILIGIGTLGLVSCSKTDSLEEAPSKRITFNTSVGKQTKYIVDGDVYPDDINFALWAFFKDQGKDDYNYSTPFIEDAEIEKFEYGWVTKENYFYWPIFGQLKFVAYSPYYIDSPTYSTTGGFKFVDLWPYYGDANGFNDIDFMFTQDAATTDKTATDAPVGLVFNHAMTQVRFTATTTLSDAVFTIKEIKIGDIMDIGTFQTLPTPHWNDLKLSDEDKTWFVIFKGSKTIDNTEQEIGFPLLYIPQPVVGMRIKIKYNVLYNGVTEAVEKTIPLAGAAWDINQKVKYALTFSMNDITFTPSINDWTTGADIPWIN